MSNNVGIKRLLEAEREARKIVDQARKDKTRKLKEAHQQAEREIEEYRHRREEEFQSRKEEIERSSKKKNIEEDSPADLVHQMMEKTSDEQEEVIKMLLECVRTVSL
eukprot:CAMPEP_0174250764 /NCGR_PEP_ID=MMETSP0439-20130205/833_1 /TAXON_ID=0 /ORGANISM="Stereomyxa ramosa, Strain Chinc5" /LENGTH=106 /DNA_ID=CAMNT_0015330917 /DNA_START=57 /DNA_END=377 /DNA_ORIENTATION=-